MKTLFIVRHAKSSWDHSDLSDFDRPLNSRGMRSIPVMAGRLLETGSIPEHIYSSPAHRAKTTAELLAEGAGMDEDKITYVDEIYGAGLGELLGVIKRMDDGFSTAMLVGHNPGMSDLAMTITKRDIGSMPTCAVVTISLDIDSWNDAEAGCGQLVSFEYPKMFRE